MKVKDTMYRLVDEYSLFYSTWIETNRTSGTDVWLRKSTSRNFDTWCGYAFEALCLKHILQLKKALGIASVQTDEASWLFQAKTSIDEGARIDLLVERADHCTNLCEMKYSMHPFKIDKQYAVKLERKLRVFREKTKTKNILFLTLVTTFGIQSNDYSKRLVSSEIRLSQLMERDIPGDTRTTVRHGSYRLRLKIRYDGAEIGEGPAGRFRWHIRSLNQKNFARVFINRAAANRLGTLKAQSS